MAKILIALGGNALGHTPQEQLKLSKKAAKSVVDLIENGNEVIIAHGNGPQIGAINLAFAKDPLTNQQNIPMMPMAECGAMSQGYIGYHLQNAIHSELANRNIKKSVATIISQVVVDPSDEAFSNPTKPIGPFYSKEDAMRLMKATGHKYIEDSGRGYRKVVPSPNPVKIVETDIIQDLMNAGKVVIAAGGGGIPVIKDEDHSLVGVEAVIDKDLASGCLARELNVDILFILTAVDKVAINFGKPNQKDLDCLTIEETERLIEEGQFPDGSMLPKVLAAMNFVKEKEERKAIISSLTKAKEAISGKTGTVITTSKQQSKVS